MKKTLALALGCLLACGLAALGVVYAQPIFSNNLFLLGGNAGVTPQIQAVGTDTNISINLVPKGTGTVQINGAGIPGVAGGAGVFTSLTVSGTSTFNGPQQAQIGTSGVSHPDGGIPIFVNSTDQATTGTVLQNLYTFSLPANSLTNTANQRLRIQVWATTAANANNKTLTVTYGATTIYTSTAAGFNNSLFVVFCDLYVTGVNTQKAICHSMAGTTNTNVAGAAVNFATNLSTPAENPTGPIAINVTGTTPTSAGDLTARAVSIDYYPTP